MKVYISLPQFSRGLWRIIDALIRYCPVEITQVQAEADAVIIFVIGRRDGIQREISELSSKQRYGVIQCCVKSTQKPDTHDWLSIWEKAAVVWSYYDLNRLWNEDHPVPEFTFPDRYLQNFYYAPLGADPEIFYSRSQPKRYVVTTSGLSYLSESVRECWMAAWVIDRAVAHLGPIYRKGIITITDADDSTVADIYSASDWVSGLRRTEGFELPAAEGLLCGVRPLLFDTPDYRHWYEPWGVFLHEGSRQEVIDQLIGYFSLGPQPVTMDEIKQARERFNWKRIIDGFYERLL